jgi:hypothetical protein
MTAGREASSFGLFLTVRLKTPRAKPRAETN